MGLNRASRGIFEKMEGMKQNVIWSCERNARQRRFLACPADEILYGGSAGPGKSEALLMSAFGDSEHNASNNVNWKSLILRRTFPDLERTLIHRSMEIFPYLGGKYDGVKHRWSFLPNGGLIQFGHMKTEYNKYDYRSSEYNRICFDELTQFTETMYLYLFSRNRTTDSRLRCQMRSATNPTGIGHSWVKRRFIEREDQTKIVQDKIHFYTIPMADGSERKISRCFIPAKLSDNPFLSENDPNYVIRLMQLPEIERRALMDGDWDVFSGQFFPEFGEEHICEPFDFPLGVSVWVSLDYGFATKTAVGFYVNLHGTFYMFDEIYCSKKGPEELALLIKTRLGRRFTDLVGRYADRRIFIKDEDTGISTQQKFSLNGIYFQLANDDRVEGWRRSRELLMKDEAGVPKFKVFNTCKNFIEKLPECQFDIHDNEDMNKRGENHHADQFRYFSIMRKHTEVEVEKVEDIETSLLTGYAGRFRDDDSKLKIKRVLTSVEHGVNYLWGGGVVSSDEMS